MKTSADDSRFQDFVRHQVLNSGFDMPSGESDSYRKHFEIIKPLREVAEEFGLSSADVDQFKMKIGGDVKNHVTANYPNAKLKKIITFSGNGGSIRHVVSYPDRFYKVIKSYIKHEMMPKYYNFDADSIEQSDSESE